jgi:hypothetical protein
VSSRKNKSRTRAGMVFALLDRSIKYLDSVGVDDSVIHDCKKVMSYLQHLPTNEVASILGAPLTGKSKPAQLTELTGNEIENLGPSDLRQLVTSSVTSRKVLEQLAIQRFGVTKGGLSMLRSRESLVEKLLTLLSHEDTHISISRAATGQNEPGD